MRGLLLATLAIAASLFAAGQAATESVEDRVALGKRLFFDPILSRDRSIACVFCHDPGRAYTDGRAVAIGVFGRAGERSAPTLLNRGYGVSFSGMAGLPGWKSRSSSPSSIPRRWT
jgi:cytochrome c peroxidase